MGIDFQAVAAISGLVAAIGALVAVWIETRRSRLATAIDILLKLEERFRGSEMCARRRAAAESLEKGSFKNVGHILNFFEHMGYLTRHRLLIEQMIWHSFFYWIDGYCSAGQAYISERQKEDPTVWADLLYLHRKLTEIDRDEIRRNKGKEVPWTEDRLRGFVASERVL